MKSLCSIVPHYKHVFLNNILPFSVKKMIKKRHDKGDMRDLSEKDWQGGMIKD